MPCYALSAVTFLRSFHFHRAFLHPPHSSEPPSITLVIIFLAILLHFASKCLASVQMMSSYAPICVVTRSILLFQNRSVRLIVSHIELSTRHECRPLIATKDKTPCPSGRLFLSTGSETHKLGEQATGPRRGREFASKKNGGMRSTLTPPPAPNAGTASALCPTNNRNES